MSWGSESTIPRFNSGSIDTSPSERNAAAPPEDDQRLLERGRGLHQGQRVLEVPVPSPAQFAQEFADTEGRVKDEETSGGIDIDFKYPKYLMEPSGLRIF